MHDPREYLKLKYIGDCKCGNCQLVPAEQLVEWSKSIAWLKAELERRTSEREYHQRMADLLADRIRKGE
jgi:hypothetical protein